MNGYAMIKSRFCVLAIALTIASPLFAQSKSDAPVAVRTVAPEYPQELRDQHIAGVVTVKFTVDVEGNVVDPEVEKSSNNGFDKAALDAVKKWKFKPAQQDGKPIAKKVAIPIRFVES